MAQPDLDYIAPEVQLGPTSVSAGSDTGAINGHAAVTTCSTYCDMFSLGQTLCAVYNNGKSLLQCGHNTATYAKRLEQVEWMVLFYFCE